MHIYFHQCMTVQFYNVQLFGITYMYYWTLLRNKLFGSMKYPSPGSSTANLHVAYKQEARRQNHGCKPKAMLYNSIWYEYTLSFSNMYFACSVC